MSKRKITLADGTEIQDTTCGLYIDEISIFLPTGTTMKEALTIFSDKVKTETIVYSYGDTEEKYTGYTELTMLRKNFDGRMQVLLTNKITNL